MTLVKGPNGLVIDVAPTVASGLIGGGHVEAVDNDTAEAEETNEESEDSPTEDTEAEADQAEDPDAEVEETEEDTDGSVKPGGNASKQVWYDYALDQGFAEEQLDGLKQSEIRELFKD